MTEPRIAAKKVLTGRDGREWLIQIPDDDGVPLFADGSHYPPERRESRGYED